MIRLLRLFAAYRALEHDLRQTAEQRVFLEDRVRQLDAMNAELVRDLREARDKAQVGAETIADFFSQWITGRKVFGHTPDLPADSGDASVVRRPRVQGRRLVQQETAEAMNQIIGMEEQLGFEPVQ